MTHAKQWQMHLDLFEAEDGTTSAQASVDTGKSSLIAKGTAHCNPNDRNIAEIGDELAAGRALHRVADQLLRDAEHDVAAHSAQSSSADGDLYGPTRAEHPGRPDQTVEKDKTSRMRST
jgi:hypothetical protein